jgi:hypothetical protein
VLAVADEAALLEVLPLAFAKDVPVPGRSLIEAKGSPFFKRWASSQTGRSPIPKMMRSALLSSSTERRTESDQ